MMMSDTDKTPRTANAVSTLFAQAYMFENLGYIRYNEFCCQLFSIF